MPGRRRGGGAAVQAPRRRDRVPSWSANPSSTRGAPRAASIRLRVSGGEGCWFWDADGPPLPGLRLPGDEPQPRPRAPAAGRGAAAPGGDAVRPGAVLRQRAAVRARPAARRGDAGRPRHDALHHGRRRRQRERRQAGALGDRAAEGRRPLPQLPRRHGGRRGAHRRPAALAGRAGGARRRAHVRPVPVPLLRRARLRQARRARLDPAAGHADDCAIAPAGRTWRRSCSTRVPSRWPPSSSRP